MKTGDQGWGKQSTKLPVSYVMETTCEIEVP